MKRTIYLLMTQLTLLLLVSCGGGGSNFSPGDESRGSLVSSSFLASRNANLLTPYSVDAYKVVYNTVDANGNTIRASGLLSIPNKASGEKSPLLSFQHGTIFLDSQAPSNSASTIQGINTLSGTGFIVSAPDFLGYGESSSMIHPYHHADSLASASVDMLRASLIFLADQGISVNEQLFLTGYSEGGYATLALQKSIQEDFVNEFTTTASAAGAGAFDMLETARTLANRETNNDPSFMSFALKAYDSVYDLNLIDEMYQAPFRAAINSFFDGTHSGSQIDSSLSHTTADLFEAPFLATIQGAGEHIIKDKLAENNLYDWKPDSPTRFFHSPNDEIVPYSNAVKALQTMQANGAQNVSLGDCGFGPHVNCVIPYVLDTLSFFSGFAEDL